MMAIFSPIAGRLSDRFQPRYLATLGMTMCTIGLTAFAFLTSSTPIYIIVLQPSALPASFFPITAEKFTGSKIARGIALKQKAPSFQTGPSDINR
jgi:MFS family permease